ncbi:hypothetical protein FSP39_017830 [Pinctada imbricata]|uniref:HECT-type E3 ubiquitin transferase n=1 Tax=Pinctada imbricata TaxID=66713 RepID=A0AA88Y0L3_PINIB|nr:hypothetical protein FSP39_017830 [Pinctada imbricata]
MDLLLYVMRKKNVVNVMIGMRWGSKRWGRRGWMCGHSFLDGDLSTVDLYYLYHLPSDIKGSLAAAVNNAKDKVTLVLWLSQVKNVNFDVIARMFHVADFNFDKLQRYEDDELYGFVSDESDSVGQYKNLVQAARESRHINLRYIDTNSLLNTYRAASYSSSGSSVLVLFIKFVLITLISIVALYALAGLVFVAFILFAMSVIATSLRQNIRFSSSTQYIQERLGLNNPSFGMGPVSRDSGGGGETANNKSWWWRLFWGHNLFPQSCVVKWDWQEPQMVGSTMSFNIELFRKDGKPFVTKDTNSIFVEIRHHGNKVACTKQLESEDAGSNKVRVSFTVHKSGTYEISIMVSGRHVKNSPFTKVFEPGPIDAARTGFTNYCSTIVCTAGQSHPLTIETQDSFGNPALYKADQNNYFKIRVVETETNVRYVPTTQLIYNPDRKQLTMHINMEKEGCYQATVSYGDIKLRNGDFTILVISKEDMAHVNKNLTKKRHNIWYEARLLSKDHESTDKAKRVYVYISPKQLTLKEYYLKIIGKKLFTWRVCPSTKFHFDGHNSRYDCPTMTIKDCSQPPVHLAAKDRGIIAATFTHFLLRNIGGSETFQDKQLYFCQEIRKLQKSGTVTLKIDRSNLLYRSYRCTKSFSESDWYKNFQLHFIGEHGLDWGGVRREWFEVVCTELFDPSRSPLFVRFSKENSQGLVHPNPLRSTEFKLRYYEFAGKIVGKCLYDSARGSAYRQLVKAKLSRSFLAQLIGLQVNYRYFETDDPDLYKTKVRYILDNNIDDMELTFSEEEYTPDGQLLRVVDLIPNGSKIPVTNDNKVQYLNALAQYKLANNVREEVDTFLRGLNTLIPDNLLSIFDENELELLMCGTGNYSIADFKANAVIDGASLSFQRILDWFWTIVASFTEEQMARLLQFTTGCSQLPPGGFADLNPKFQISFAPTYNALPTAHTCFNQLCLPDYGSIEHFHQSLLIAINEGSQGFGLV